MKPLNIAVVGAGISGLAAAWLLSRRHRVTVFEQAGRPGGHANTVDVDTPDGCISVDTGFIVYNEPNYPNLTALFDHLGVATRPAEMTFSFSRDSGAYEYSGTGAGFFGQRRNLARPSHWRLLGEIARFFREAEASVGADGGDPTLGELLQRGRYSREFIENHLVPMGAAIWSTPMHEMMAFPASSFVAFYANHGMLRFRGRPGWRTVVGGSRTYVERMLQDGSFDLRCGETVRSIRRHGRFVRVEDERGVARPFDEVVIATHADEALSMLCDADGEEARLLSAFRYQRNTAVLHRDPRWMPQRRRLWSSWNYLKAGTGLESRLCVTYWMNRLQSLATGTGIFVTLNAPEAIHPKATDGVFSYAHPVFDHASFAARQALWRLQGHRRTWFCGAHFGHGFHEDGLQSGLAVAEALGGVRRPWQIDKEYARMPGPLVSPVLEAAE